MKVIIYSLWYDCSNVIMFKTLLKVIVRFFYEKKIQIDKNYQICFNHSRNAILAFITIFNFLSTVVWKFQI